MNERIERLKGLAQNIQAAKLGMRGEKNHINSYTVIDEYHEWRTESEDLFEEYFDETNGHFKTFKDLPRVGNGYTLMHYFNQQYPIFNTLIKKIEEGKKMNTPRKIEKPANITIEKNKEIFISHASKDEEIVNAFVDLLLIGSLGVTIDQIFCVSTDGTKIKSGLDWRNSIKDNLLSAKINFLFITPNYKESEVCLNEMGAAWVTSGLVVPLIVEPINYRTVGVIQEPSQIEKLMDEHSLDRIKDLIQEKLEIPNGAIKSDRWTAKKKEFLSKIKIHIKKYPFDLPMDREVFSALQKENTDLNFAIESLVHEKTALESLIKDLEKAKNKDDVRKAHKKHELKSDFNEFEAVAEECKIQLKKFTPIVRGIIFKEFTGKDIKINWEYSREEIDNAIAEDYINEELEIDWDTTAEMRDINKSLNILSEILERNFRDEFIEDFNNEYQNTPMKIENKTFWEIVFKTTINF